MKSTGTRAAVACAVALGSILFALGVGEVALRTMYPTGVDLDGSVAGWRWLRMDPVLGWKNQAGFHHEALQINSDHFRGGEVALEASEGTTRIFCIGDSRMFGVWTDLNGVRLDNDYPAVLAQVAAEAAESGRSARKVEVVNAAVIGYTVAHGLRQFITRDLAYSPDIAIVGFGFNDLVLTWDAALRSHEPKSRVLRTLLYTFHDFRVFQFGLRAYQRTGALHPGMWSGPWNTPEDYRTHLRRFAEVSRENGVRLLFLNQVLRDEALGPSLPTVNGGTHDVIALLGFDSLKALHERYREYQQVLFEVAEEMDVPVADTADAFRQWQGEPLFGMHDVVHVNEHGARRIAEILYQKLVELNWI